MSGAGERADQMTATPRPRVILESPCAGTTLEEVTIHQRYAHAALRDALARGEAPIASHVLWAFSGVLREVDDGDRAAGIAAGLAWLDGADYVVVYVDLGMTRGMRAGIDAALARQLTVEYRAIPDVVDQGRWWWGDCATLPWPEAILRQCVRAKDGAPCG